MQEIPRSQNRIQQRSIVKVPREFAFVPEPIPNEFDRDQYLTLLKMARQMRKEPAYLAMRMFVCTGIQLQEFLALTVEAVKTGEIQTAEKIIRLPDSLREELLDYAQRNGASGGAIFASRAGATLTAAALRRQLQTVSRAAGFDDGVVSVRALQKLYETTRAGLMAETTERLIAEQLDREQAEHGWKN